MIRLTLACLALGVSGLSVTACNTVQGLGRDIEAAGRGIARSSDEVRGERRAKLAPAAQSTTTTTTTSTTR